MPSENVDNNLCEENQKACIIVSEETSQYKAGGFLRSPRHFLLLLLLLLFTVNLCKIIIIKI